MNSPSNAMSGSSLDSPETVPAAGSMVRETRPMAWSIRRELWENRSIYIAPLVVAGVVLLGFLIATIGRALATVDPAQKAAVLSERNSFGAVVIMATAFIVGVFYCLDALHGERRDRTILFWKSLPVSDLVTVLSKASIPLVVLPLVTFVVVVVTQLIMLVLSTAALLMSGLGAAMPTYLPLLQKPLILLYTLVALALWHAPIYAWLLLISGWARRATFLWAVLPPIALCVVEKIAFNTSHLASLLADRFTGFAADAFAVSAHGSVDSLAQLTPLNFLAAPGLWIGLAFAAALLTATVRLRRYREAI